MESLINFGKHVSIQSSEGDFQSHPIEADLPSRLLVQRKSVDEPDLAETQSVRTACNEHITPMCIKQEPADVIPQLKGT